MSEQLFMYCETLSSSPGLVEHAHVYNLTLMVCVQLWVHSCTPALMANVPWEANPCIPSTHGACTVGG